MSKEDHWDNVYATKASDRVSWHAPHLGQSLKLIESVGLPKTAEIIDVGGGTSTLPADLLDRGFHNLTVLDISSKALEEAKSALGDRSGAVNWVVGDVTRAPLPEARYDLWHDRAVFHFLTDPADQEAYVRQVARCLAPGGHVIVATFGAEGPEQCSGLDVVRYDDTSLLARFGATFGRVRCEEEHHVTPWGSEQQFVYCLCRRLPDQET